MAASTRLFKPQSPEHSANAEAARLPNDELFRRLGLVQDRTDLVKQVQRGFRVAAVEKLASELRLPQQTVLKITKIAPATLARRRKGASGRLSPEESDRVYRIAAAYRDTLQLFEGDAESARRWLSEPAKALGGDSPLQHLTTEAGAAEVHDLIGRLEHGVYT
jgi:putative toxin-antitoxin system antitoxin component (TIGR02293 family)